MKVIDLAPFKTAGSWVMSGRPKGDEVRKHLGLDAFDASNETFEVRIPKEIIALNRSFFLGLFGASVRHLSEEKFREKYTFLCSDGAAKDVESGIQRALIEGNAIPSLT